ncbi:MAG: thioredoxin-dependent thiol peroxidase [Psychrosphaera sp.]|nr:thioredoxin-dependent thiol peroxidase [Psychrosphaera sp.]
MNTLKAGDKAPAFTLNDQNGDAVALTDYLNQGQVLVYFYPKAMTPGCIIQAEGLRDSENELKALNVKVIGISPDPVKKLANFVLKKALNFTLVSDEDHAVADGFGVWGEKKFMGKIYDGIHRQSFLINSDGSVAHVFNKFKTKEHHTQILDYLNSQAG